MSGRPGFDAGKVLAPTGRLRVGAFAGSPLSLTRDPGEIHGLSIDLGREFAKRLGVPFEQRDYQRIAEASRPHERSDMRDQRKTRPGCRVAHPGYGREFRHCEERQRRSNPSLRKWRYGLLPGVYHRAALRADPLVRNNEVERVVATN